MHWHKKYTKVLKKESEYMYRWFPDGEINICYNAIDRHIENGDGDKVGLIYDSSYTNIQEKWTYKDL